IITFPITDQAPAFVTFDADRTVDANALTSLADVTFSDPGQDDVTASIDWGDGKTSVGVVTKNGTPAPTTGTVSGSHRFALRGTPDVVTVPLQDNAGATTSRSFEVAVVDPAVSVNAGHDRKVREGDVFDLSEATFTDPGAPGSYTATVDWGDGSPI